MMKMLLFDTKRNCSPFWIIFLVFLYSKYGYGLQGVPTWISLGIKSPFIEFKNEYEILHNTSVSLNLTQENSQMLQQRKNAGLKGLDKLLPPFDMQNVTMVNSLSTAQNLENFQQTMSMPPLSYMPLTSTTRTTTTSAPWRNANFQGGSPYQSTPSNRYQNRHEISTDKQYSNDIHDRKITIIEDTDENFPDSSKKERKYIIPLALKTTSNEREKTSSIFHGSSTNIDDLKQHILMLQNLTKTDKTFQSKFVVFPNLQKPNESTTQSPTTTSTTTASSTATFIRTFPERYSKNRISLNTPRDPPSRSDDILRDSLDSYYRAEKITIIPQVLLQNDQTPTSMINDDDRILDDYEKSRKNLQAKRERRKYLNRNKKLGRVTSTTSTTSTTTTTTTTTTPAPTSVQMKSLKRNPTKRQRLGNKKNRNNPEFCKKNNSKCLNRIAALNATETVSIATSSSNPITKVLNETENQLIRTRRSQKYPGSGSHGAGGAARGTNKDVILPILDIVYTNETYSNNSNIYKEQIDLNPNLCYKVGGLSHGQQKLCAAHTSIMPSISRGARAAIQECKHQFRHRRWNCSTTDDDTVFGPMTNIGSPEMAFVHAIAAAGAASFIARACRDGQLASCGCSRSSRPKHLHKDWTWGGCGDELEFGYTFSVKFVDIREKERKRGTRGLVSIPQKYPKIDEKLLMEMNETNDNENRTETTTTTTTSTQKPYQTDEHLLKLQQKITKELLNSNLEQKEMNELQEKINKEIMNSKIFSLEQQNLYESLRKGNKKNNMGRLKGSASTKARSLMNIHNNEAGRRAVISKSRITCKCHGVSGSCSLITCWKQLTSMREIGDFLREKYDAATQVKLNKRGRLQVKDARYKVPTEMDLVYLDESPDWCRNNKALQWQGTHGRVCNKTSSGLDGCAILCCGRGYNTKKIVVRERCNCKFQWCCHVKCDTCTKVIEEFTCK